MAEYRWNQSDLAAAYDAAAEHIHPHYIEVQDVILRLLPFDRQASFLLLDLGGGSGRLAERFLRRFGNARAVVLDRSEAFLALAQKRFRPHGSRAACLQARLQDDWMTAPEEPPSAIVSMSAIHHLDAQEKQALYQRCFDVLAPGGVFLNGDEVRAEEDADYLAQCRAWAAHMHRVMDAGLVAGPMCDALGKWEERNVVRFSEPKTSGDDCHETVKRQADYLAHCGFAVDVPWQKDMWAVLRGVK